MRAADIRQIYQSWELPAENEENGATFRKSVQSGGRASMTMECSRLGMMSAGLERLSGLAARPRVQNVEFGTFRSNSNSLFLFFSLKTRFNAMVRHNWHFNHICLQKMFVRNTPMPPNQATLGDGEWPTICKSKCVNSSMECQSSMESFSTILNPQPPSLT